MTEAPGEGTGADRRRSVRRDESVSLSLTIPAVDLAGVTMNMSNHGLLLQARGRIPLVITIGDKRLQGTLVRALPDRGGVTVIAVELDEPQ
jgi:hypothetical protein